MYLYGNDDCDKVSKDLARYKSNDFVFIIIKIIM